MGRGGDTKLDGEATPNRGGHDDIEPDTQVHPSQFVRGGCPLYWIGDGYCDYECYTPTCSYDAGDCDSPPPPPPGFEYEYEDEYLLGVRGRQTLGSGAQAVANFSLLVSALITLPLPPPVPASIPPRCGLRETPTRRNLWLIPAPVDVSNQGTPTGSDYSGPVWARRGRGAAEDTDPAFVAALRRGIARQR